MHISIGGGVYHYDNLSLIRMQPQESELRWKDCTQ